MRHLNNLITLKHPKMLFPSKNKGINRQNLGVTIQFASSSLINGSDAMLECKSMPLSHGRWIPNEALRFFHIAT